MLKISYSGPSVAVDMNTLSKFTDDKIMPAFDDQRIVGELAKLIASTNALTIDGMDWAITGKQSQIDNKLWVTLTLSNQIDPTRVISKNVLWSELTKNGHTVGVVVPAIAKAFNALLDTFRPISETANQWCSVCHSYHVNVGEKTDAGELTRQCPLLDKNDPANRFENFPRPTRPSYGKA